MIRYLTEARAKAIGVELAARPGRRLSRRGFHHRPHAGDRRRRKEMLNAAAFAKMKPGVQIVNCARGEIIVENDLIAALESGKVAGAALDVFCDRTVARRSSVSQACRT